MPSDRFRLRRLALILAAATLPTAPAAAAETTVSAFSSWAAEGDLYQTGPSEATFVGTLSGVVFVEGADSSLEAARMFCPGRLQVDTETWRQTGSADCVIVTTESERIYGEFQCEGEYREGCEGEFVITGGSGSKEGITGSGPILFSNAMPDWAATPGSVLSAQALGLVRLPELTFRLP